MANRTGHQCSLPQRMGCLLRAWQQGLPCRSMLQFQPAKPAYPARPALFCLYACPNAQAVMNLSMEERGAQPQEPAAGRGGGAAAAGAGRFLTGDLSFFGVRDVVLFGSGPATLLLGLPVVVRALPCTTSHHHHRAAFLPRTLPAGPLCATAAAHDLPLPCRWAARTPASSWAAASRWPPSAPTSCTCTSCAWPPPTWRRATRPERYGGTAGGGWWSLIGGCAAAYVVAAGGTCGHRHYCVEGKWREWKESGRK